jgi:hypothetical protein
MLSGKTSNRKRYKAILSELDKFSESSQKMLKAYIMVNGERLGKTLENVNQTLRLFGVKEIKGDKAELWGMIISAFRSGRLITFTSHGGSIETLLSLDSVTGKD